jgi:pyruvate ferredoxin oxidoreductase beta subunit
VIGSEPLDLARKLEKASQLSGPRLILSLAACPTGWDYDPKDSVEVAQLAVKTGVWPLKEYLDGEVTHTKTPRKRIPVEQYLVRQGRFTHLFEPERQEEVLADIQARIDSYWKTVEEREG